MLRSSFRILLALLFVGIVVLKTAIAETSRPNVILVMTDDQGYGDLACHGNKVIKTPALDKLHAESVRLTNYHVDPTCSPTRSALMTGRYSSRTGVWHTIMGRSMLHPEEYTLGELFAANGYRTGAFGKWHLGDNYPLRAQDQGFHEVLMHGGGGVGQTPDYWGNDYFDDTYWHNGKPTKYKGYCTDVFFDGALKFIKENKSKPFFVYLPTNAAHGPFLVAKKYSDPYKKMGVPSPRAEFYGMITNIDENMARLRKKLKEWGLAENTILIFTTDNGTAAGMRGAGRRRRGKKKRTVKKPTNERERHIYLGYNAGMRGQKGSEYDGGHRVPFFVHWPKGGLTTGRDVGVIAAHIDVMPTLASMCKLTMPTRRHIDGIDLSMQFHGIAEESWPNRTLFVHSQRVEFPQKWRKAAVMTDRWRLVANGDKRELFDMKADPGQKTDVKKQHPKVFKKLQADYEKWYASVGTRFKDYVRIHLGNVKENPVRLTCHDWHTNNKAVPWHQGMIKRDLRANGFWAVKVERSGPYEITLRVRPEHDKGELRGGTARLQIGKVDASKKIPDRANSVTFKVNLTAGDARLRTAFEEANGRKRGAYFVEVKYLGKN